MNSLLQLFRRTPRASRRTPQARIAAMEALEPRIVLTADGNDTLAGAISEGSFSGVSTSFTNTGTVGSSGDNVDYRKFTLTSSNHFVVSLSGMSRDLDLKLLDNSGSIIASSLKSGTQTDSLNLVLTSGTYYLGVFKVSGSTVQSSYSLNYQLGDDTRATAISFGTVGSGTNKFFNSSIGGNDTIDYYSFTVTGRKSGRIDLTQLSADLDLELVNSSGVRVGAGISTNGGTANDGVSFTVNAGTYYIKVYKGLSTSSSSYKVNLKIT